MSKSRLEAFSDGVIAIIITIMVLELKAPHGATLHDLVPLSHAFLSYLLSFIYVGIYWNNHHHIFHAIHRGVSGMVLWGNLHLLFWLSLIPFTTSWVGDSGFATHPVAVYGLNLLMCAIAWDIEIRLLVRSEGGDSTIAKVRTKSWKENISVILYVAGIVLAFVQPYLSIAIFSAVAAIWFLPDRRVERALAM